LDVWTSNRKEFAKGIIMNILVTGGAGFIGYHTCAELCRQGHSVVIFDNLSSGNADHIDDLMETFPKQVVFFHGDVKDLSSWSFTPDAIMHLAAKASVQQSIENPVVTSESNILGFLGVCDFAKKNNVKRVIYASSAAVYGDRLQCEEYTDELTPMSPYGLDKVINEIHARFYTEFYGIETVGLRYFNVYGPYQNSNYAGVISNFISCIKNNQPLTIYGSGTQSRNFIHVKDVAKINAYALTQGFNNFVLNVGNPDGQFFIKELYYLIQNIANKNLELQYLPGREGDIHKSYPILNRLYQSYPDYNNMISMVSGLRNLI